MKEISYKELKLNPFTSAGDDWWLVSAGNEENGYNGMTASWGHLGSIWNRPEVKSHGLPTAIVYVRPQRYTKVFFDREELFTVSIFGGGKKKELAYLGTHSGRDEDKFAAVGFTPVFTDGTFYPAEAETVLICRKIYQAPLRDECFADHTLSGYNYPEHDFHDMYVGEVIKVLVKD